MMKRKTASLEERINNLEDQMGIFVEFMKEIGPLLKDVKKNIAEVMEAQQKITPQLKELKTQLQGLSEPKLPKAVPKKANT